MKLTCTKNRLLNFHAVASSSMDFVLVSLLILDLLSLGQSSTAVADELCYEKCSRGYHKVGDCINHPNRTHKCEKCADGEFTDIENTSEKCERCSVCPVYQKLTKECTYESNTECDCQMNYYNAGLSPSFLDCQLCPCSSCKEPEKECQGCTEEQVKRCLNHEECKRICGGFFPSPVSITATNTTTSATSTTSATTSAATSTTTSAATSTTTSSATSTTTSATKSTLMDVTPRRTRSTASNNSSSPDIRLVPNNPVNHLAWLLLVGSMFTFLVIFLLLLLLLRIPNRYLDCFACWIANKNLGPMEETKFNDQCSHQGSSPTMLTITTSEETPMMPLSQSPATSEHRTPHSSPALPDAEHKDARPNEQSEHWPAIVLYTIIKEVPLRRWKEFLRLLSIADQQLERVELEVGFGLSSIERQYQMLRLWSQRSTASLDDVFSALHYMDLSGCAQVLQESLEKLKWRPFTDQGFSVAVQKT